MQIFENRKQIKQCHVFVIKNENRKYLLKSNGPIGLLLHSIKSSLLKKGSDRNLYLHYRNTTMNILINGIIHKHTAVL